MSKQTINIGASPNDGTGTPLRTSFDYTNQNFTEIYTALGGGVALPGATTQVIFNDGGTNLAGDAGLVYNKTTDALTVAGLVTAGSANISGALTVDTSTLVVNASTDRVGIGTATPTDTLDVNGRVTAVGYFSSSSNAANPSFAVSAATGIYNVGSYQIGFSCNGSLAMTLNASGNLAFPTGKGIDFSAVTGGTGTATANVLNDYEEGTWTPTDGSGAGLAFTVSNCRYTKVGRAVTVQGTITYPVTVNASNALWLGFPFTAADIIFLSVAYTDASIASFTYLSGVNNAAYLLTPGVNTINSTLSGKNISFFGTYMV